MMSLELKMVDNFKLYRSIHETTKLLNNEQHGRLMKAIQSVQFFEVHIDSIDFDDKILKIAWSSAKVQIKKQLDGYCSRKKLRYNGLFKDATDGATDGAIDDAIDDACDGATQQSEPQPKPKPKSQPKPQPKTEVATSTEDCATVTALKNEDASNRIAEYLLSKILALNPTFKKPNLKTWAKDIDKAMRLDNRTEKELIGCIDWIYTDRGKFWKANILSGKKLRDKFDVMQTQSRANIKEKETAVDKLYDNGLSAQDMIKQMEMRA